MAFVCLEKFEKPNGRADKRSFRGASREEKRGIASLWIDKWLL